jgi:hypothetical protein
MPSSAVGIRSNEYGLADEANPSDRESECGESHIRMHTKKVRRSPEEQDIARSTVRISEKSGKK